MKIDPHKYMPESLVKGCLPHKDVKTFMIEHSIFCDSKDCPAPAEYLSLYRNHYPPALHIPRGYIWILQRLCKNHYQDNWPFDKIFPHSPPQVTTKGLI